MPGIVPAGHAATGGVISDYTSGSDVYRAHVFTSSGQFDVTSIGVFGSTVDFLVVGGGGGGGRSYGGGGGAGGFRSSVVAPGGPGTSAESALPISAQTYTVTVGGGGAIQPANGLGNNGSVSTFSTVTSEGGGGGGALPSPIPGNGQPGGSGGGGCDNPSGRPNPGGTGSRAAGTSTSKPTQGYPGGAVNGGAGGGGYASAGGGGAGGVGESVTGGTPAAGGQGGLAKLCNIAGPAASVGYPGPSRPRPGGTFAARLAESADRPAGGDGADRHCRDRTGILSLREKFRRTAPRPLSQPRADQRL